jgi:pectate lyase
MVARRPRALRSAALAAVATAGLIQATGCTVQDSQLLASTTGGAGGEGAQNNQGGSGFPAGGPNLDAPTIAVIDERPIGGASLSGGTTGGGSYAQALARGAVYLVDDIDELRQRLAGDNPAVVLVAEGSYTFSAATPRAVRVCNRHCDLGQALTTEIIVEAYCTNGETVFDAKLTFETVRVGSNKTVIGLGHGATLKNAELDLSGSSNVILRNLSIEDVAPDINGKGDGITIWPGDHIWIDHVTLRNLGHAYIPIHSSWDEENDQALSVEAGYITLTHNRFDGHVAGACNQKSDYVLGTSRNPALTLAYNWFEGTSARNGYLFGPGTWAHVFNNYWSDIDHAGLSVACGALALAQGNVFENTISALYNDDDGVSSWKFCKTGLFGTLYAPLADGGDERNLIDPGSTLNLHEQPTDGAGLMLPVRQAGHRFRLMVLGTQGRATESYEVTLEAEPSAVAGVVRANAGSGRLF